MAMQKYHPRLQILQGLCVLAAGACCLTAYGQDDKTSASGGVSVNISGSVSKEAKPATEKKSEFDEIRAKVKEMQELITNSAAKFAKAANGSAKDRIAQLDGVIATIDSSLKELGENGKLYQNISTAIAVAEQKQKYYKDKASDPKVDGKIREGYDKLSRNFETQLSSMYDKKILLSKEAANLTAKKNSLGQQKDFVADLIQADEMQAANDALIEVIASVKGVADAIDNFAGQMTAPQPAEGRQQK